MNYNQRCALLLVLLTYCGSCIKKVTPATMHYPVTALLNNTIWFGNAQATKIRQQNNDFCSTNRMYLFIKTDIPYKRNILTNSNNTTTGCLTECTYTQLISFYNVPLKKGKYRLAKLDKCGTFNKDNSHYILVGTDGVHSGGVFKSYRADKKSFNWIRISRYDTLTHSVEGQFKLNLNGYLAVNLPDSSTNIAHFRQGTFKAEVK